MPLFFKILPLIALLACKDNKAAPPSNEDPTKPQTVTASSNPDGIILVDVENKDEETLKIHIPNIPPNAELSCELNGAPIDKCVDGMEIAKPKDGNHRLRIRANSKGSLVAVGETRFQIGTVPSSPQGPGPSNEPDPLSLEIANTDFTNGNAIRVDQEFTLNVRFTKKPSCNPILRCFFDKTDSDFSPICNLSDGHKFTANRLAHGLQYLTIQANCDAKLGPKLTAYWYGVGADYKPLQVESTPIGDKSRIFRLVKSNDCPEDLLKFQCAPLNSTDFLNCTDAQKNSRTNLQVRANCNGQLGPILNITY